MSLKDSRNRIKSAVWKAIAQGDLDLESISPSDQEALVEIVTEAALIEIDDHLDEMLESDETVSAQYKLESEDEQVLWKGRPFLSLSQHYIITDQRIRLVRGLLGKDREDIELIRIQDIDQKQTLRERLLNLGDLTIHSHDTSDPIVILNNVRDPETVQDTLRKAVLKARKEYKMTFQDEM